jgi:hypothetical protein
MAVENVFWASCRESGKLEHRQSVLTEQHMDQEARSISDFALLT